MNRILSLALGCSFALLAGCGGGDELQEPNTSFDSAKDTSLVTAVTGTYTGMTAQGAVTMTLCEDVDDEPSNNVGTDYGLLDGDVCVAHNVYGGGRGKTEEVALGPVTYHYDNSLDPSEPSEVSCTAIAATPVHATLKIGDCAVYDLHGAMVLATGPKSDPYAPPFTLALQLDSAHVERLDGQMPELGGLSATYSDVLWCHTSTGAANVTAPLHRTGPEGCATK
jgi:hypothetical protein